MLVSSGAISLSAIAGEFGGSKPHSISEFRGLHPNLPASGTIRLSNFYGTYKAATPPKLIYSYIGSAGGTKTATINTSARTDVGNPHVIVVWRYSEADRPEYPGTPTLNGVAMTIDRMSPHYYSQDGGNQAIWRATITPDSTTAFSLYTPGSQYANGVEIRVYLVEFAYGRGDIGTYGSTTPSTTVSWSPTNYVNKPHCIFGVASQGKFPSSWSDSKFNSDISGTSIAADKYITGTSTSYAISGQIVCLYSLTYNDNNVLAV